MKRGIILVPYMSGNGGTEKVIQYLFKAMGSHKEKIFITLLSIGGTSNSKWLNNVPANVTSISKYYSVNESKIIRTMFYLTVLPIKLYAYLKKTKPDFIISTNPVMWTIAKKLTLSLHLNIPIIGWYHYSLEQHPIKAKYIQSADYFLAISSGIKRQLVSRGVNPNNIFLVYNPIASDYSLIQRTTANVKFIYIGRLMLYGQKNIIELFNALKNVKGKWELDVYGSAFGPKAASSMNNIVEYVEKCGLKDKVKFYGYVKKPWSTITSGTALVLTSKFEGLPTVLCEAISHGLYCISSNAETGPSDIINSQNGVLYAPGDVKELTRILQNIVNSPNSIPRSDAIRETSYKFSISSYRKRFEKALDKILSNNGD